METTTLGRRQRDSEDGLQVGARKKIARADPLVHRGRHFGRVIYAFANVRAIVTNGLTRLGMEEDSPENYTQRERQEHDIFLSLLQLCPDLQDRIAAGASTEEVQLIISILTIEEQIAKGASASRGDDTKGMKSSILDWITPPGENLIPPLNRRGKADRGFRHEATGSLLCPANMNWEDADTKKRLANGELLIAGHTWPTFLYEESTYDTMYPWKGLLRSQLLVTAYKHIFISPSSAETADLSFTTKSGNARIHGMTRVTKASLVYVATQVRFALSAASSWSRTDKVTDSETFYTSLLGALEDPKESNSVKDLLQWWDKCV
ncbi:hypothetical protein FPV67DRAFT_1565245 [Lyophyllum atratum]|nr:hypothetical protein FPV67DRAFT_1565245 [Lyophyllum atratum]